MADIKEVDYDQIINGASQIASAANEMQKCVKEAFIKIESMSNNWFGNSYDNFIKTVNLSIFGLNELFEISVSDIPHEIAAKAKSYASANQASCGASFVEQTAIILSELPKTNKGTKLRFRSTEVLSDQQAIVSEFKQAISNAEKAQNSSVALEQDWQSISGDTNIQELKAAFTTLKEILEGLSDALDGQISAQANVVDILESAANMVQSAKDVVGDKVEAAKDAATSAVDYIQQSASDIWTNLTGKN